MDGRQEPRPGLLEVLRSPRSAAKLAFERPAGLEELEVRAGLGMAMELPSPLRSPGGRGGREEWARAFELWLDGKAESTRRAYGRAWRDLLRFTGKEPSDLLSADVQAWAEDLSRRAVDPTVLIGLERKGRRARGDGHGLSASTISLWLSAASSFYRYVASRHMVPCPEGGERPLHGGNPTLTVRRPDASQYARTDYLDAGELTRLLAEIPRDRVAGLRDYALFLGYVLTGRRNAEWRTLRWGDLRGRGSRVFYTWRGKNTDGAQNEMPPPLWEAVRDYLEASGRLEGMREGDYLFVPLTDNATRLPNVQGRAWDRNRPLGAETVNRMLRKYARRAGLDGRRVHVHVLRHSAAMLEEETGTGLAEISKFLGHADPKTTMRYLGHLRGRPDTSWEAKVLRLGLAQAGRVRERRRRSAGTED